MSVNTPELIVAPSRVQGLGVFAATSIRKGDLVLTVSGKQGLWSDFPEEQWVRMYQVAVDTYVMPEEGSPGGFVNHSCDPSCDIRGLSLFARRDIMEGEEITFDYSENVIWKDWKMECRCGAPNCRRVLLPKTPC